MLRPGGYLVLAYTRPGRAPGRAAGWLLRRRLARAGFDPPESAAAGEGGFSLARLSTAADDV